MSIQTFEIEEKSLVFKILVVGSPYVGKTAILEKYIHRVFASKLSAGVDYYLKEMKWNDETILHLQFCDIAGSERSHSMRKVYYKGAVGAFVMFDISKQCTLERAVGWKKEIDLNCFVGDEKVPLPVVLLANKVDLVHVDYGEKNKHTLDKYCEEHGFRGWFPVSAQLGTNIENAVKFLCQEILQTIPQEFLTVEERNNETVLQPSKRENSLSKFQEQEPPLLGFLEEIGSWWRKEGHSVSWNHSRDHIDDIGVSTIASCLLQSPDVTDLNLQQNDFGPKGTRSIAKALKLHTKLRRLNLLDCRIGNDGAQALYQSLCSNTTLVQLKWTKSEAKDELLVQKINRLVFLNARFFIGMTSGKFNGSDWNESDFFRYPFSAWSSVRHFDLRHAHLSHISTFFGGLDPANVKTLLFHSQGWDPMDKAFAHRNPAEIISFAKGKQEGTFKRLNEGKLMLLGGAGTGKTSILRCLRSIAVDHTILSTNGIVIEELNIGDMTFVAYDFAGQKVYQVSHQLFLRDHCIYLVVFRLTDPPRFSVEEVLFWVNSILVRDPKSSSILLVGTHADRLHERERKSVGDFVLSSILKRYVGNSAIQREWVEVKCTAEHAQESMKELKKNLLGLADQHCFDGPAYLETSRRLLKKLMVGEIEAQRESPLIPMEIVHFIIEAEAEKAHLPLLKLEEKRNEVMTILEQLGYIFLIRKKRGEPPHTMVRDVQWMADLLASLITTANSFIKAQHGVIEWDVMRLHLWKAKEMFPEILHEPMISLLKELNFCYEISHSQTRKYFVPSLLPRHKPIYEFARLKRECVIERNFKMSEGFLVPVSVVPMAVIQMMEFGRVEICWQGGCAVLVPLEDFEECSCSASSSSPRRQSTATLTCFLYLKEPDELRIQVSGPKPGIVGQWMRVMVSMVENLLGSYGSGLFTTTIPCPLQNSSSDCFFEKKKIFLAMKKGVGSVSCSPNEEHTLRLDWLAPDLVFTDIWTYLISWNDLEVVQELGSGGFGRVVLANVLNPSSSPSLNHLPPRVALKLLEIKSGETGEAGGRRECHQIMKEFQTEIWFMISVSHPNVVKLYGFCLPGSRSHESPSDPSLSSLRSFPAMVMEVVPEANLYHQLHSLSFGSAFPDLVETLKVEIAKNHNMRVMHEASPDRFPAPPLLLPLPQLCNEAYVQIQSIFQKWEAFVQEKQKADEDIESWDSEKGKLVDEIRNLQQRLQEALSQYYDLVTRKSTNNLSEIDQEIQAGLSRYSKILSPIDWNIRLKIATDIALGVSALHSLHPPLIHRDLKTPNIFLTRSLIGLKENLQRQEREELTLFFEKPLAKVGDLGLSVRSFGSNEVQDSNLVDLLPTWAPPELLKGEKHSTKADIYSFGIILWELIVRAHPFDEIVSGVNEMVRNEEISEAVKNGTRPEIPKEIVKTSPPKYLSLLKSCWAPLPEERPNIFEVFQILRELAEELAPDLFHSLPNLQNPANDLSEFPSTLPQKSQSQKEMKIETTKLHLRPTRKRVTEKRKLTQNKEERYFKVSCGVPLKSNLWIGTRCGTVCFLSEQKEEKKKKNGGEKTIECLCCRTEDKHKREVTAMALGSRFVWSGSQIGSISVWEAKPQTFSDLREKFRMGGFVVRVGFLFDEKYWLCLENGCLKLFKKQHFGLAEDSLEISHDLKIHFKSPFLILHSPLQQKEWKLSGREGGEGFLSGNSLSRLAKMLDQMIDSLDFASLRRVGIVIEEGGDFVVAFTPVEYSMWSLGCSGKLLEWGCQQVPGGRDGTGGEWIIFQKRVIDVFHREKVLFKTIPQNLYSLGNGSLLVCDHPMVAVVVHGQAESHQHSSNLNSLLSSSLPSPSFSPSPSLLPELPKNRSSSSFFSSSSFPSLIVDPQHSTKVFEGETKKQILCSIVVSRPDNGRREIWVYDGSLITIWTVWGEEKNVERNWTEEKEEEKEGDEEEKEEDEKEGEFFFHLTPTEKIEIPMEEAGFLRKFCQVGERTIWAGTSVGIILAFDIVTREILLPSPLSSLSEEKHDRAVTALMVSKLSFQNERSLEGVCGERSVVIYSLSTDDTVRRFDVSFGKSVSEV